MTMTRLFVVFSVAHGLAAETMPVSLREKLLVAITATARGQALGEVTKASVEELARTLEAEAPPPSLTDIGGRWALAYASTQLFRSSPFWMAGRETCRDEAQARRYDLFCDLHRRATAVSEIGAVRQLVDPERRTLTSEFETTVAAFPQRVGGALPLTVTGAIVSTADVVEDSDGVLTLLMDKVQIKGSNLPGLRPLLDSMALDSRSLANALPLDTPRPRFQTTYVDSTLRIARDLPDRHLFIYVKEADDPTPTDYSAVPADLGVPGLLAAAAAALPF